MARPTALEQRRREREFFRLLATGLTLEQARTHVGMDALTVIRMLDRPGALQAAAGLQAAIGAAV